MKQLNHTQGMLFNLTTQEDKQIFSNKKHENIGRKTVICFQRILREQKAKQELRTPITNLNGCTVSEVSSSEARKIIEAYEWLGTMGRTQFSIGLHSPSNELLGVACFGLPGSQESRNICGPKYIASSICLERGACVPHAPKNAASFLISHACKISAQRGYPIVYAYADEDAGEMGTVYQACNWIYIGQGVGRSPGRKREYYRNPQTGETIASRTLRHRGLTKKQLSAWVGRFYIRLQNINTFGLVTLSETK